MKFQKYMLLELEEKLLDVQNALANIKHKSLEDVDVYDLEELKYRADAFVANIEHRERQIA